jgi:sigma-E factor negative regulatory protein RseA
MAERHLNDEPRQRLSALVDGECGSDAADDLCRAWRDDAALRETWHAYNLIGDVLRSEDLAHPSGRDEAFLAALRRRMADEPVVLAPAPVRAAAPQVSPARRAGVRWAPLAAAAGFVAVAGVLVSGRLGTPGAVDSRVPLAAAPAAVTPVAASSMPGAEAEPPAVIVTDGKLIRDAHLDRYLAAHKQFGGSAVAVPGIVLRSAATVAPAR